MKIYRVCEVVSGDRALVTLRSAEEDYWEEMGFVVGNTVNVYIGADGHTISGDALVAKVNAREICLEFALEKLPHLSVGFVARPAGRKTL